MSGWDAFLVGLSVAARYRRLVLALFVVSLIAALVAVSPAALNLAGPAKRPAIREASDGVDAWLVVEAFLTVPPHPTSSAEGEGWGGGAAAASSQGVRRMGLVGAATVGTLLVLAWLSQALLRGGALATYSEDDRFSWGQFVRGCWRWFGTFLLLGPLLAVGTLIAFLPLLVLVVIGFAAGGRWLGWIVVALCGGAALLWRAAMDMAYVVAVADERWNVFQVLRRAAGFVLRHPLAVAELYGLAILTWTLVTVLYGWGLRPRISHGGWLLLFSLQQVFVVIWLFVRLARLAGGIRLYQARSGFQEGVEKHPGRLIA